MRTIGPNEILENGTEVVIKGGKKGYVLSHEEVRAHPCGMIVVHTIQITKKFSGKLGNKAIWKDANEKWRGNYSFVQVEN